MRKTDRITSEKALNRALVDVALRWGVDPERARQNPVFWHDGSLNYYDPVSHREEVFAYFKDRGILDDGFNRAFKLNFSFDELDEAADADYARGINLDVVVGLLIAQLHYGHGEALHFSQPGGRPVIVWSERTSGILKHLYELEYVELAEPDARHGYRWAEKAEPMLKAHYLM